jgi:hypothetical protein
VWAIVQKVDDSETIVTLEEEYDVAVEVAYRYNFAFQTNTYRVERI